MRENKSNEKWQMEIFIHPLRLIILLNNLNNALHLEKESFLAYSRNVNFKKCAKVEIKKFKKILLHNVKMNEMG